MALSQRLEMRQSQGLVMTPQLMQAIKLLQLSSLDLAAYVETELEKNPLLERTEQEGPAEQRAEPTAETGGEGEAEGEGGSADWASEPLETSRSAIEQGIGTELENVFPDDGGPKPATPDAGPAYSEWSGSGAASSSESYNLEAFVSAAATLSDHLTEQMALAIPDPVDKMIGQYLIDMVDEAGYLGGELEGVAEKLGCSAARIAVVLDIL